jgi:sulfite reductase beta subunit
MLDHEWLDKLCEIPLAIAACPTAAIKPSKMDIGGKQVKSVAVNPERCMFCGNCYTMCPSMPLSDREGDGIVIMAGGKVSNRINPPKFSKVVVAFLPNEAPRWPSTVNVIRQIVEAYSGSANKYERIGDWAERIGWERFFEKCNLKFTHHLIDDFRDPAYYTWRQTTQFKFTE